jgi:hypothetical protein
MDFVRLSESSIKTLTRTFWVRMIMLLLNMSVKGNNYTLPSRVSESCKSSHGEVDGLGPNCELCSNHVELVARPLFEQASRLESSWVGNWQQDSSRW